MTGESAETPPLQYISREPNLEEDVILSPEISSLQSSAAFVWVGASGIHLHIALAL